MSCNCGKEVGMSSYLEVLGRPERRDEKSRVLCVICDNYVPSARLRRDKRICSAKCWYDFLNKTKEDKRLAKEMAKVTMKKVNCEWCGVEFEVDVYRRNKRFCTKNHRLAAWAKNNNIKAEVVTEDKTCPICDTPFKARIGGPGREKKYCSPGCKLVGWRIEKNKLARSITDNSIELDESWSDDSGSPDGD